MALPRRSAPRGLFSAFGFGHRGVAIEGWLLGAQGELLRGFRVGGRP